MRRLLDVGPEALDDRERGMAFWRSVWAGLRLEERLRAIDDGDEGHVPPGLTLQHLDDLLDAAPYDIRFHLSRGAAESFANTLPLLHPRGYLQVQDIFVPAMEEYRQGFRGPGQARRLDRHLGQRRPAARRRGASRLRRALRAVPLSSRIEDDDPVHDSARLIDHDACPCSRRPSIGSYSMPEWLKRAKNDYLQRA